MNNGLWIFAGICAAASLLLAFSDAESFVLRLRAVKRRDRTVPDAVFALVMLALVAVEAWAFQRAGAAWADELPILVLSAYVPITFLFYCNLVGVGTQREVSWMAAFLGLCAASWARYGRLDLLVIFPPALALTALFCFAARRDHYCRYRLGMRRLDELSNPKAAEKALRQAVELAPQEARYAYHLGRALKVQGRTEEGASLMRRALAERPNLAEELRNDLFFKKDWL